MRREEIEDEAEAAKVVAMKVDLNEPPPKR